MISRKTGLHRNTVSRYLFEPSVLVESEGVSPEQSCNIGAVLPEKSVADESRLSILTNYFPHFDRELSRRGVTRQLLWEEYREAHPSGGVSKIPFFSGITSFHYFI